MVKFKNLFFFIILDASKLIKHMILLLMGDMLIHVGGLEPNRIHWLSLRNHKDPHEKITGFRIFQPFRSKTGTIRQPCEKNARGSLKQNCQPPQYLIFDDSKHCV